MYYIGEKRCLDWLAYLLIFCLLKQVSTRRRIWRCIPLVQMTWNAIVPGKKVSLGWIWLPSIWEDNNFRWDNNMQTFSSSQLKTKPHLKQTNKKIMNRTSYLSKFLIQKNNGKLKSWRTYKEILQSTHSVHTPLASVSISFSKRKSGNCPESLGHLTQLASLSIQEDNTTLNTLH